MSRSECVPVIGRLPLQVRWMGGALLEDCSLIGTVLTPPEDAGRGLPLNSPVDEASAHLSGCVAAWEHGEADSLSDLLDDFAMAAKELLEALRAEDTRPEGNALRLAARAVVQN